MPWRRAVDDTSRGPLKLSSSPGELKPVFETMLANATRICQAKFGVRWVAEDDGFRSVATHGLPPAHVEERRHEPLIGPHPQDPLSHLARTKQVVHIADLREEEAGDATGRSAIHHSGRANEAGDHHDVVTPSYFPYVQYRRCRLLV